MSQVITICKDFARTLFKPLTTTNMQKNRLASKRKILYNTLFGKTLTLITNTLWWYALLIQKQMYIYI